jgi:hypothetical protein
MNISQDLFNKIITSALLLYTMIMYTWSWAIGRPLDLNSYLILVAPLMTHTTHLLANKLTDKAGSNGIKKEVGDHPTS